MPLRSPPLEAAYELYNFHREEGLADVAELLPAKGSLAAGGSSVAILAGEAGIGRGDRIGSPPFA